MPYTPLGQERINDGTIRGYRFRNVPLNFEIDCSPDAPNIEVGTRSKYDESMRTLNIRRPNDWARVTYEEACRISDYQVRANTGDVEMSDADIDAGTGEPLPLTWYQQHAGNLVNDPSVDPALPDPAVDPTLPDPAIPPLDPTGPPPGGTPATCGAAPCADCPDPLVPFCFNAYTPMVPDTITAQLNTSYDPVELAKINPNPAADCKKACAEAAKLQAKQNAILRKQISLWLKDKGCPSSVTPNKKKGGGGGSNSSSYKKESGGTCTLGVMPEQSNGPTSSGYWVDANNDGLGDYWVSWDPYTGEEEIIFEPEG